MRVDTNHMAKCLLMMHACPCRPHPQSSLQLAMNKTFGYFHSCRHLSDSFSRSAYN